MSKLAQREHDAAGVWPALPLSEWQATARTLHMWTQIVGKIRLARAPMINHWWQVPLYATARGLTTSPMPADGGAFEITFDFIAHQLRIERSDGVSRSVALVERSVADFYRELMATLAAMRLETRIWTRPVEVVEAIPFERDREHASYDAEYARRFWEILSLSTQVLTEFRGGYLGKTSPVHFFWGSFDLALTRFSGRRAPDHPGGVPNLADWVVREAYSHEASSCGFWPGGGAVAEPCFYAYQYPEPAGFAKAGVRPAAALYSAELREFILPYEAMRTAQHPSDALLSFVQSTYEVGADLAQWDRPALERDRKGPQS